MELIEKKEAALLKKEASYLRCYIFFRILLWLSFFGFIMMIVYGDDVDFRSVNPLSMILLFYILFEYCKAKLLHIASIKFHQKQNNANI